jgi:hypothetical protein
VSLPLSCRSDAVVGFCLRAAQDRFLRSRPRPRERKQAPVLQALINAGDFEEATKRSEELLSAPAPGKTSRADEGLFALGLINAHADNPRKDYRRSREHFARLVKDYPGSTLAGESKIWIGVLDVIEKTKQVDIEIEGKKKVTGK